MTEPTNINDNIEPDSNPTEATASILDDGEEMLVSDAEPVEGSIAPENVQKYVIYLCFEWMEMESCIQFYIETDKNWEWSNAEIVMYLIHQYEGIAEQEDGTVINLMQFKQSYVYLQDRDYQAGDETNTNYEPEVEFTPDIEIDGETPNNVHTVDFK